MEETTEETNDKTERLLNCHMQALCRIFSASDRVSNNFQSSNNDIPPIYGLRKDHKDHDDMFTGPPLRPVCGAVTSCNYRISYFLSQVIKPLIQISPETCDSTEDLLSKIKKVNENEDLRGCIIGSMDVKALYPSIDIDFATDKCVELLRESEIVFTNVNEDELGLYLILTVDEKELVDENIRQFCPNRKRKGKKPTITGCASNKDIEKRWEFWNKSKTKVPDGIILRKIVSFAIGVAIKTTLKNHICGFDQKIFKQSKGGAIGVGIAGDVANLFMVWWDRRFRTELLNKSMNSLLYSRYVDDTDIVLKGITKNANEEIDKQTMEEAQKIANNIHESIQVTIDYPSNHENGRMPCLDTEQWIEEVKIGDCNKPQILHSHYQKKMSNRYLTLKQSATSYQSKINTHVANLVRVFRNISPLCEVDETIKNVKIFLLRLQHSGYNQAERYNVYRRAKRKYSTMVDNDKNGIIPLYRDKFWNQEERIHSKRNKMKNWFSEKGRYDAVFFVEATQNMKLAIECQKILKDIDLSIKVVERAGINLKQCLVKSNPFERRKCKKHCHICLSHPDVKCKSREVIYKIKCEGISENVKCKDDYEGETVRSLGERYKEHIESMEKKSNKSVLYTHFREKHNSNSQPLSLEIIERCPSDAMLRQVTEAVSIRDDKPTLNCKTEFGNMNIARTRK